MAGLLAGSINSVDALLAQVTTEEERLPSDELAQTNPASVIPAAICTHKHSVSDQRTRH